MKRNERIIALAVGNGSPAPSLLPWVARNAAEDDLPRVAILAAAHAALAPMRRWPVIADATAEVIAHREGIQMQLLLQLADVLPPVMGYVDDKRAKDLIRSGARADAVAYASIRDPGTVIAPAELLDPLWHRVLAARRVGLPPLANLGLLARLAEVVTDPAQFTGSQLVYLLPYLDAENWGETSAEIAAAEISDCLVTERPWYAAALFARSARYLGSRRRSDIRNKAARLADLPAEWAVLFENLSKKYLSPWPSAAPEIAAAHPAMADLETFAGDSPDEGVTRACTEIVDLMFTQIDPGLQRWMPDPRTAESVQPEQQRPAAVHDLELERPGQVALAEASYEMGGGDRLLLPGHSTRYLLLEVDCQRCGAREYRIYYDERDHVCKGKTPASVRQVVIADDVR